MSRLHVGRRGSSTWQRALCVGVVLALTLVACGSDGDDPAGDDPASDEPADAENGDSEPDDGDAAADPDGGNGPDGVAGSWDEILAAAADEGEIVMTVHRGSGYEAWCERVVEAMSEYDIAADCTAASPSDFVGRVIAEQQAGEYLWDVIVAATGNIQAALIPAEGVQPFEPWMEILDDQSINDEDNWVGGHVYTDESETVFLHEYVLSGGAFINTDILSEDAQPDDVFDESLAGQLVSRDPTNVNGGSMSLAWFLAQEDYGEDAVRELIHDQEMVFVEDPGTMLQWVADGRAAAGFGANGDDLQELQDAGIGTNIVQTDWAEYVISYGTGVLANNPNPNATAVFLNWHLSEEGQQVWADVTRFNSSSRRVGVEFPAPEFSPVYDDMSRYPPVIGTAVGTESVEVVTEIALDGS